MYSRMQYSALPHTNIGLNHRVGHPSGLTHSGQEPTMLQFLSHPELHERHHELPGIIQHIVLPQPGMCSRLL